MKTKRSLVQNLLLPLLFLLALPAMVQAQFTFTTNNDGSLNIYQYTGSGGAVTIPSTTNGLPITSIGLEAFDYCYSLTSISIPDSVTNIGPETFFGCSNLTSISIPDSVTLIGYEAFDNCTSLTNATIDSDFISEPYFSSGDGFYQYAFAGCTNLTSVTIGTNVTSIGDYVFGESSLASVTISDSVTNIGEAAFADCLSLTSVTIPNSVTSIGEDAFAGCYSLTNVTIGASVTNIEGSSISGAFFSCIRLTSVYFAGNAPAIGSDAFDDDPPPTFYYLPGTTGWQNSGFNPELWNPQAQNDASFGVRNNQFGFNITGYFYGPVVVEACTNLANPVWVPVSTNTVNGSTSYFSDPQWTNYPGRFYGFSFP